MAGDLKAAGGGRQKCLPGCLQALPLGMRAGCLVVFIDASAFAQPLAGFVKLLL